MPVLAGFYNYGGVPGLVGAAEVKLQKPRLFNIALNDDGTATAQTDGIPPELIGALRPAYVAILLQPNFAYAVYGNNKALEPHVTSYSPCGFIEKTSPVALKFTPADELAKAMTDGVTGQIVGLYASQTITGGGCQHGSSVLIPPDSDLLKQDAAALQKIHVHKGLLMQANRPWTYTFHNPAGVDICGGAPTAF
jgi:hypothetical protein